MMKHVALSFAGLLLGSGFAAIGEAGTFDLALGSTVSGTLAQPGASDSYTFTGAAGQRLIYDALDANFDPIAVQLINPGGAIASINGNSDGDVAPFTLTHNGTYTLKLDGSGATIGGYKFRLLDVASQPIVSLATVVSKTLDPGLLADLYRLNGSAGQKLFFDWLTTGGGGTWILYGPNNETISSAGFGGDFEVTLNQDGTYALALWGSSSTGMVPYSFQVDTFDTPTASLTMGAVTTGTLLKPGDRRLYTFNGTPGQRLAYDSADADFDQIGVQLLAPTGATVGISGNSDSDVGPFTLTEPGTYTLVIDGVGATVGDYTFRLLDIAGQSALAFDTAVSKTLDPGFAAELYQFDGPAGQRLYFDGQGGGGANWVLYSPNNEILGSAGSAGDFEVVLPLTGKYVLGMWGSSAIPVPYTFQVVQPDMTTTGLTLGNTVSGTLTQQGEQQKYTFTGTAGQWLYFDAISRAFLQINARLISPSGATVWEVSTSSDQGPFGLTASGDYALIIDGLGQTTGNYSFRLLDLAAALPLNLTATTSGQIDPPSGTVAYQLAGTAGQRINFDSISSSASQPGWRLVSPANQNLAVTQLTADLGDVVLPATGTYALLLEGAVEGVTPVSYQFRAADVSGAPVPVVGLGDVHTGNIAAGQRDTNSFTAPAGRLVYFDSQDRNTPNLVAELRDPTEAVVFTVATSTDSGPHLLPRPGAYRLVVYGNSPAATGTYQYRLLDLQSAPPLPLDAEVTANLDPGFRTDVYQFTGQMGQRLVYDALQNDFQNVVARLFAPEGYRYVGGNADGDVGPFTLLTSGTYYLFFESNLANPVDYRIRLLNVETQPPLAAPGQVTGTLDPGLGINIYRLTGTAGLHLFFDGAATNAGATWALFGPNNEALGSAGLSGDMELTLTQPGRYALVLSGNATASLPYDFQVFTPDAGGAVTGPRITSITRGNGDVTLAWTATAGKSYRVESKANLGQAAWSPLPGDVTASEATASKLDNTASDAQRFYRVAELP